MAHPSKAELRDRMLMLETEALEAAREHYEDYLSEAHLAKNEPHENDEMAASRMAADLAHGFDDPIHDHAAKIAALKELDISERSDVGPGAVVKLGGRYFIVAVSTRKFDCGGKTYMGISRQSPVYQKMAGLTSGDKIEQNGVTRQAGVLQDIAEDGALLLRVDAATLPVRVYAGTVRLNRNRESINPG